MHSGLVEALRSRGVPVITVLDTGLCEKTARNSFSFAGGAECVLYTCNVSDFHRLHLIMDG